MLYNIGPKRGREREPNWLEFSIMLVVASNSLLSFWWIFIHTSSHLREIDEWFGGVSLSEFFRLIFYLVYSSLSFEHKMLFWLKVFHFHLNLWCHFPSIIKIGHSASFSFIFGLFKQTILILQQIHLESCSGIRRCCSWVRKRVCHHRGSDSRPRAKHSVPLSQVWYHSAIQVPLTLFHLLLSVQTNITIFQQIYEKMSIQYTVLGIEPMAFRTLVSPLATRPGLPPKSSISFSYFCFSPT